MNRFPANYKVRHAKILHAEDTLTLGSF